MDLIIELCRRSVHYIGKRPSNRTANWLRAVFHVLIGIVHLFEMFSMDNQCFDECYFGFSFLNGENCDFG